MTERNDAGPGGAVARRADLLELGTEALTALANAGFVRRAQKDVAAGRLPDLAVDPDGTVSATFEDGAVTVLPPATPVKQARCSCPASGWCRHRVMLVLAYQGRYAAASPDAAAVPSVDPTSTGTVAPTEETPGAAGRAAPEPSAWSPGRFTDKEVAALVPARTLERARQSARSLTVRLTAPGGMPTAHLPMSVVRFFSSSSLAHSHCDCRDTGSCEHLALAVWAFRQAGGFGSGSVGEAVVVLGAATRDPELGRLLAPGAGTVRDQVAAACRAILLGGAANADSAVHALLDRVSELVRRLGWAWVHADLTELDRQLQAYRQRSTAADPARLCAVLAEAPARLAAALAASTAAVPHRSAADILGVGIPGEVELAQLRLVSLGARTWTVPGEHGEPRSVGAQTFWLDPDTGQVSVLERTWDGPGAIGDRRMLGATLARIAESQLVTAAARRRALGLLEVAADRRRTSVTPMSAAAWPLSGPGADDGNGVGLPRWADSRNLAAGLTTVAVDAVTVWGWDAAAQRLDAHLESPDGPLWLEWAHSTTAPGGVDAIAELLHAGALHSVSGAVRRQGGELIITPLALGTTAGVVVPAVRAAGPRRALPPAPVRTRTAHGALVAETRQEVATWVLRGLRHQGPTALERLAGLADRLASAGLPETAGVLATVVRTTPDDPDAADDLLRASLLLDQLDGRL